MAGKFGDLVRIASAPVPLAQPVWITAKAKVWLRNAMGTSKECRPWSCAKNDMHCMASQYLHGAWQIDHVESVVIGRGHR
jgi:hypothetical protein